MWIKICANTNLEDALLACELGADAVGFVFAPSKRQVTPEQVAAITVHLPPAVAKIGVFQTHDAAEILSAVRTAGLTGVQLHGAMNTTLAQQVREGLGPSEDRLRLLQVVHWWTDVEGDVQRDAFAAELAEATRSAVVDAVLVDSRTRAASGGTGVAFDWRAAAPVIADVHVRTVIAGGLTPLNVAKAVSTLRPFGVDVASGVEATPGRKDAAKLMSFLRNARAADRASL